jgi:hypothetical protein
MKFGQLVKTPQEDLLTEQWHVSLNKSDQDLIRDEQFNIFQKNGQIPVTRSQAIRSLIRKGGQSV